MMFLLLFFGMSASATLVTMDSILDRTVESRVREYRKMGEVGRKYLIATAFDPRMGLTQRWRALTTMGRWDAEVFRPQLEAALRAPEWFMRNAGLIAIQNEKREMAVAWSLRLLDDRALVVRTQAVRNLIDLQADEAEPLLWRRIWDPRNFHKRESLWIRPHIAEALALFARPGRIKDFQRLLMDRDERLHRWAVAGLEKTTGIRLGDERENKEVSRQKWLARLGVQEI